MFAIFMNDTIVMEQGKKEQVRTMFNGIAQRYDFLNHFLSVGIDRLWRKKLIKVLRSHQPKTILDVATGTGDLAIEAVTLNPSQIVGVDIAESMLELGRQKIKKKRLEDVITLTTGDSENLDFPERSFDAVMVAFGVRNYEDLDKGLKEMFRVLNNHGIVAILEFSHPKVFPVKQLYQFYFKYILPVIGRLVSKHRTAYSYLPDSVGAFPDGGAFVEKMTKAGFRDVSFSMLTFGIATLYFGVKK